MKVVVEVEDIRRTVAKPCKGFAVGYMVIGTEAGKVVAERMKLIPGRIVKATNLT